MAVVTNIERIDQDARLGGVRHVIRELKGSRDGSVEGAGGTSYRRRFRVFIDMEPREFTNELYPNPGGIMRLFIPFGSAHPWNAFAIAQTYTIETQENPGQFIVSVGYRVPEPSSGIVSTGWILSARGVSIPVTRYQTLDGQTLGPRVFAPVDDVNAPFRAIWTRVNEEEGTTQLVTQGLIDTGLRKEVGFQAELEAYSLTLTRVISKLSVTELPAVAEHMKKLNSHPFLGADGGHVKLDDWSLDEVSPTEFDSVSGGGIRRIGIGFPRGLADKYSAIIGPLTRAVRVSLTFLYAADPQNPDISPFDATWFSTWTPPEVTEGEAVVVDRDGQPVIDHQQAIVRKDFNAFMQRLTAA